MSATYQATLQFMAKNSVRNSPNAATEADVEDLRAYIHELALSVPGSATANTSASAGAGAAGAGAGGAAGDGSPNSNSSTSTTATEPNTPRRRSRFTIDGASSLMSTTPTTPDSGSRSKSAEKIIELARTGLTSRNFTCAAEFFRLAGTLHEPCPLNLIVQILHNETNRKTGRSAYRILMVGCGFENEPQVRVYADMESDLYNYNPTLKPGTIVAFLNVKGMCKAGAISIKYLRESQTKTFAPEVMPEWEECHDFFDAIKAIKYPNFLA